MTREHRMAAEAVRFEHRFGFELLIDISGQEYVTSHFEIFSIDMKPEIKSDV